MSDTIQPQPALGDKAARQLANATKTPPQFSSISPRWLTHLLQWLPVEAGIYRLNKVKNPGDVKVACTKRDTDNGELPQTFVDYEENPREYFLNSVSTVLDVHTRISDLYSSPYDQIKEQLRLTTEAIKERQESELINNPEYGLLASVDPSQRITTLSGAPTPDDLDDLLAKVWKEPAFFLTHPLAIAAFGRECTRRGTPPPTISLFGSQFITWRGLPLIPSDKVPVEEGKSKILLLRVGEKRQGVVGLFQPGLAGEQNPGLSVRFMGISRNAVSSYLISLYCSLAVLTEDALAVLDDVEVGKYHDYPDTYK
jgi:encapsulin shell SprI-like protein